VGFAAQAKADNEVAVEGSNYRAPVGPPGSSAEIEILPTERELYSEEYQKRIEAKSKYEYLGALEQLPFGVKRYVNALAADFLNSENKYTHKQNDAEPDPYVDCRFHLRDGRC